MIPIDFKSAEVAAVIRLLEQAAAALVVPYPHEASIRLLLASELRQQWATRPWRSA